MNPAPIALFAFNRPEHLRRTVTALRDNDLASASDLHVFCDGPRSQEDEADVEAVRAVAGSIEGFASLRVVARDENVGLAESIIAGVTDVCETSDRVIVIEDDLSLSPYLLQFLNDGLSAYHADEEVISISGFTYPHRATLPETFFMRGAYSLGWATWSRGWELFDPDAARLLREIEDRRLQHAFDVGHYPYTRLLRNQAEGRADSWAIRWYASGFLRDRLTLFSGESLVRHMGFGAGGTNVVEDELAVPVRTQPVRVGRIPLSEDQLARREFKRFLRRRRIKAKVRRLLSQGS